MNYRLTCLTPLLVGDGSHLSPIDYMVWKDQVNVLDQGRIFRLLAKGPRLDTYLKQIARADKLDFASWGGFAQNFADRRIEFEHPACARYWEALPSEHLRIPTFIASPAGPYMPASALRGALRTALVGARVNDAAMKEVAAAASQERAWRHLGDCLEERVVGRPGHSRLKTFAVGDSTPVERSSFKIYMLRVSSLASRNQGRLELRWKESPRGSVEGGRPQKSTPVFAEMASPGTVFGGPWREIPFYRRPEIVKALRWKHALRTADLLEAANQHAERVLSIHYRYAETAGLLRLRDNIGSIQQRLSEIRGGAAGIVNLGWGGGFLSKSGGPDPSEESYRGILSELGIYSKAIRTGLPFPKTRRIVFLEDRPAALPGWALLEIS